MVLLSRTSVMSYRRPTLRPVQSLLFGLSVVRELERVGVRKTKERRDQGRCWAGGSCTGWMKKRKEGRCARRDRLEGKAVLLTWGEPRLGDLWGLATWSARRVLVLAVSASKKCPSAVTDTTDGPSSYLFPTNSPICQSKSKTPSGAMFDIQARALLPSAGSPGKTRFCGRPRRSAGTRRVTVKDPSA